MHIRRLSVLRYGPLKPFDETLSAFTVIHGPNERGKTLLIDALVRMLFKDELKRTHYKLYGNLTRVDERPEGFVVMATHADEVKIGAEETLATVAPVAISPEDFRNVFLIRDSDLALKNEDKYYERVSERLCGTRSGTIDRLREALRKIGHLRSATPESPLTIRKDRDHKRIGEQLVAAQSMLDAIAALRERLEADGFDAAYRHIADLAEERTRLESDARRGRDAERKARLLRARDAVAAVRELIASLAAFGATDQAQLDAWRALISERAFIERDLSELSTRLDETGPARDEALASWEVVRARAGQAAEHRDRTRAALRPLIEAWVRDNGIGNHAERGIRAIVGVMLVSAVMGVAASVAAVITRSPFAMGAVVACALCAAGCGVVVWRNRRGRAALARREIELVASAAALGVKASAVPDIEDAMTALERDAEQMSQRARELELGFRQREGAVASCQNAIAERRARLEELAREEETIQRATGRTTVEALSEHIAHRRAVETDIATHVATIKGLLPSLAQLAQIEDRDRLVDRFADEVERGLAGLEEVEAVPGGADAVREIEHELERVTTREREGRERLERSRQDLRRVEMKVSELGVVDGPVHCRTTRELGDVYRRVLEFCDAVQRDQRLAQEAIRILNDVDAEEREKVGELFGPNTIVSRWFHEITGHYRAVHLEVDEIEVERADGRRLPASSLSGGAYDQLYLAIRASIAERMLPETRGFFILDDPFLKADRARMETLMRMLRDLVGRGWQVIYITAKDEVVDALRADIHASRVRLIELEPPLFARAARIGTDVADAPRLF
jgi:DNA repair protein SbcC/Rad50